MLILSYLFFLCLIISCNYNLENTPPRQEIDFNFDWKFFKTKIPLTINNLEAQNEWKDVKIPHDWAIETPYNQGYKVTDSTPSLSYIGWYKKEFELPNNLKGKNIRIDFDGVYNNAEVYLNGEKITERPYGFSPFSAEITNKINLGKKIPLQ